MKNKLQKAMKMAFALFMAAVMICNTTNSAQAAGYVKSFTKTVTLKGGTQCLILLETKAKSNITVTISTTSKPKNLNIQATVPSALNTPNFTELTTKKKGSVKVQVDQGTPSVYVTNYGMGKAKVTIKVSAPSKVLKFKSKEISENIG